MPEKLSIIIPAYNEGSAVRTALEAVQRTMAQRLPDQDYEVILVDDGSRDDTFLHMAELHQEHPDRVRVVKLAVNRGAHKAIRAGLDYAQGDAACFIPCDLQEPPELLVEMLAKLEEGYQVVAAVRNTRDDPFLTKLFSRAFWAIARKLASNNIPARGAGTFLLGPQALKAVRLYKESNLALHGLFATIGFEQATVTYDRRARRVGKSKWTWADRLYLFADIFVGHSYVPIRLMSLCGFLVAISGILWSIVVVLNRIFLISAQDRLDRWMSFLVVIVLLLNGMLMMMTGVLGEYLWRSLDESRRRPLYLVEKVLERSEDPPAPPKQG